MESFKTMGEWSKYYRPKFFKIFNFQMPYDYTGIDLTKLEGLIFLPDDESIRTFVTKKWGIDAINLLEEIVNNPPPLLK